jgi:hypothetical protein
VAQVISTAAHSIPICQVRSLENSLTTHVYFALFHFDPIPLGAFTGGAHSGVERAAFPRDGIQPLAAGRATLHPTPERRGRQTIFLGIAVDI